MTGLGLNIVIGRMTTDPASPLNKRLERVGVAVATALDDVGDMLRAEAVAAGVSQGDLEEHLATAVRVLVGNRCSKTLAATQSRPRVTPDTT